MALTYDREGVARRLKAIRKRAGYNQTRMAEILGIKQATLSDYEHARYDLSADHIHTLHAEFKVSLEWILYGDT